MGVMVMPLLLTGLLAVTWGIPSEGTNYRVSREQPLFGTTHLDIQTNIINLSKNIKLVEDKLNRHEARESQVSDWTVKTLNALNSDHSLAEKHFQTMAKQLAKMEERIMSMESLILTNDERQRVLLNKLKASIEGLGSLPRDNSVALPPLPPRPDEGVNKELDDNVKKIVKKVNKIENFIVQELKKINNEVKIVGESMDRHVIQLHERHERLSAAVETCDTTNTAVFTAVASNLAQTNRQLQQQVTSLGEVNSGCNQQNNSEVTTRLESLDQLYKNQTRELKEISHQTHKDMMEQKITLEAILDESHLGQMILNGSLRGLTQNMKQIEHESQESLTKVTADVKNAVDIGSVKVMENIIKIIAMLNKSHENVLDVLEDAASMTENLQHTVAENHDDMTKEIKGLHKVEQVMINTADAVLDTKRSIEFGIQQIILELGDIVKSSGKTINSTLSDQISNISFAILKNQTSALTNMTAKMEKEISQVWRQIGIMYTQMTESVNILEQVKNVTRQHMNASMTHADDMDGTVGLITNKVEDVESNLNYLLGRLSLVASEFNQMKSGVGDELLKLKQKLEEENNPPVEFPAGGTKGSNYAVNRKREVEKHWISN